jgi:hypothetical protein
MCSCGSTIAASRQRPASATRSRTSRPDRRSAAHRARQPAGGAGRDLPTPDRQTPARALFARGGAPGRVDWSAQAMSSPRRRGVAGFTLLLSPDQFDFGKPVKVITNGKTVFEGRSSGRANAAGTASDNDARCSSAPAASSSTESRRRDAFIRGLRGFWIEPGTSGAGRERRSSDDERRESQARCSGGL